MPASIADSAKAQATVLRTSIPIRRHELESHGIWDIDRRVILLLILSPAHSNHKNNLSVAAVHTHARPCFAVNTALSMHLPISSTHMLMTAKLACRLCDPYVTWALIQEEFGEIATEVASKYFEENVAARRCTFRAPYSR